MTDVAIRWCVCDRRAKVLWACIVLVIYQHVKPGKEEAGKSHKAQNQDLTKGKKIDDNYI
jgi:hypothetical protein